MKELDADPIDEIDEYYRILESRPNFLDLVVIPHLEVESPATENLVDLEDSENWRWWPYYGMDLDYVCSDEYDACPMTGVPRPYSGDVKVYCQKMTGSSPAVVILHVRGAGLSEHDDRSRILGVFTSFSKALAWLKEHPTVSGRWA